MNHYSEKLCKTDLVNTGFAYHSRTVFWNQNFYFCLIIHKLDESFTFIWKIFYAIFSMSHFAVEILWPELWIIRRKYNSSKIPKILLVISGNKLNFSHNFFQISIFCYYYCAIIFQYFDVKIALLDQNRFVWTFFWLVDCCVF